MITSPAKVKILPLDAEESVRTLIDITERLVELMEEESRSVALTDKALFVAASEEKQKLADFYEQAAGEFKKRLNEFRTVDKELLEHLDSVQKKLGLAAQDNMEILDKASFPNS